MPNGKNHGFGIPTRQKDDELFRLNSLATSPVSVPAAAFVEFAVRRVVGYGVIRFLVISPEVMTLRIEEAPTPQGPWVETARVTGAVSTSGSGQFFICTEISPCGTFMRIFLDNGGAGAATPDLIGFGHPIAGGGGSGGGGGGGTSSIVQLRDGSVGTTLVSVKTDGTLIGPQGSILVGGEGPGGVQQSIQLNAANQLIVAPLANRATFEDNQKTVAAPGTAEQLQSQAIPDGFTVWVAALDDNTGNIYFGNSKADAENHTKANILQAGAFRLLALQNVDAIWIDADVAGEGVQWLVEI